MANQIRVQTSVQIVQDNDVTVEGIAYTHDTLDGNADSRSWGGKYNLSTAYVDAKVGYWKNAVISVDNSPTALNADWDEGSITDGAVPGTAYVVAVEYVKTLGTVATVEVVVSGEVFASLTLGESIVIPMHMGEAIASITIKASAYTDGTHEATVNVMVAGTA